MTLGPPLTHTGMNVAAHAGEMRVNIGGDPGRDDYGLPPVDIEIPDDARELDRDVQAYRRELRALRRSERRGRWHRSLSKDGVVLPLLACCLILALITGTLLTVFTATSDPSFTTVPGAGRSVAARIGGPGADLSRTTLPDDAAIVVADQKVPLRQLGRVMLVIAPPDCNCAATLRWLAAAASAASAPAYLVYTPAFIGQPEMLYRQLDSQLQHALTLAAPSGNWLNSARTRAGIPARQITALLAVGKAGTWVRDMSPSDSKAPLIRVLTGKPA